MFPSGWKTVNKPSGVAMYTDKGDAIVMLSVIDSSKRVSEIGEEARDNALKSKAMIMLPGI